MRAGRLLSKRDTSGIGLKQVISPRSDSDEELLAVHAFKLSFLVYLETSALPYREQNYCIGGTADGDQQRNQNSYSAPPS